MPTTQRQNLLRPYPQFGNIDVRRYDGSSSFDSAQFRLERRFSGGYTVLTSYTWSNFKEQVTKLNDTDTDYEERYQDTHLPHRLVMNGIWELPFGHGRRFGSGTNQVTNAIIGNWSVSAIWNWQSGRPNINMGNVYYDGDITQLKTSYTSDPSQPVFDTSGFYFHDAAVQTNGVDDPVKQRADQRIRLANNVRAIPSRWNGLRGPRYTNWDMSFVKGFELGRVACAAAPRALQRVQRRVLQQPERGPDQRQLRAGDQPEQPAEELPDRDEDRLLGSRRPGSESGTDGRAGLEILSGHFLF